MCIRDRVEVASRPVVTRLPSESTVTKPSVEYAGFFAGSFEAAGSEEAALEELALSLIHIF